ncbi:MAG: (E)-4-hydroxy-3-methylbut-2-enyl-diphosphate synthase [Bacteroidales bacterium]|nr:(E)-4-hydroxy-3-methylbut-2-enyl-diphosphate synthase [Bacteroidales bacterium]
MITFIFVLLSFIRSKVTLSDNKFIHGYTSRIIQIGNLPLGGNNPIRIQSMTSTNTMDTKATVEQSIRMIDAGCEMVRITAQGVRESENLAVIKQGLKSKGYEVPIIADIHFNPKAAELAARIVDKVRINPGNYIDRNQGKVDYSELEYQAEIHKIRERLQPLITICKEHGTVIRIGSNHGSLSGRILSRFGDTPLGMVESAMEFVRICAGLDFHKLVLSMKASNVKVMVMANRLLIKRLQDEGFDYPIHLGVTEAGDAEDGRIKSAAGIGTLLHEGIGDTIRVSLTEDPEFEIPVAKRIINSSRFEVRSLKSKHPTYNLQPRTPNPEPRTPNYNPFSYKRRETINVGNIGGDNVPVVIVSSGQKPIKPEDIDENFRPDYICTDFPTPEGLTDIKIISEDISIEQLAKELTSEEAKSHKIILIINSDSGKPIQKIESLILSLIKNKIKTPVILKRNYIGLTDENFLIQSTSDFAFLLIDGLLDGIWIKSDKQDIKTISEISFGILQATGDRISKTEYIACPSCGRTLFNIQDTLQKIKAKTKHLKTLKIGVMGCIVNGPGEMTDADYGYVGSGPGKVTLYRSNHAIEKNINEIEAIEKLIDLIKADGKWIN